MSCLADGTTVNVSHSHVFCKPHFICDICSLHINDQPRGCGLTSTHIEERTLVLEASLQEGPDPLQSLRSHQWVCGCCLQQCQVCTAWQLPWIRLPAGTHHQQGLQQLQGAPTHSSLGITAAPVHQRHDGVQVLQAKHTYYKSSPRGMNMETQGIASPQMCRRAGAERNSCSDTTTPGRSC